MIDIIATDEFTKRYQALPIKVQKRAQKQERLFRDNPWHPSLHTEKLIPKDRETWSLRVDRKYRIIFRFRDGQTAIFLTIGPHDWVYRIR